MGRFGSRLRLAPTTTRSGSSWRRRASSARNPDRLGKTPASGLVGTSDHDIVAAINASIAVLQGGTAPAPFNIKNKREALRLLAHYVGDIHQPLHVVSIYLANDGQVVDPDSGTFDPNSKTRGGLLVGSAALHSEWDGVPAEMKSDPFLAAAVE